MKLDYIHFCVIIVCVYVVCCEFVVWDESLLYICIYGRLEGEDHWRVVMWYPYITTTIICYWLVL